jgi:glyoxylase-like metal-dependent hydrolase (beta-lactamase superfamily II)
MDGRTNMVKDGDKIIIGGFTVDVISIPGHSSDSVVYKIANLLFTGDVLTAGLVGKTASAYGATTQMNKLRSRLLSLPGDYVVLPGHGPPSTLEAERRFNTDIFHYDKNRSKRPVFKVGL